jgi:hypothetical protein
MVPAYFDPGSGFWNKLADASRRVPLVAIANVFNGPGTGAHPGAGYTQAIQSVRAAGGQVIGYVYTQYGDRAITTVKADMLRWHELYPLDGFFVDEMSNEPSLAKLDYYSDLVRYARELEPAYRVVGNPGTNTEEAYRQREAADVLTIFESDRGYESFVPAAWTRRYPPFAFAHLTYAVSGASTMTNYVSLATSRSAGFIYVTDDGGGNPWDRLPIYWNEEVAHIESLNRAAAQQVLTNLTAERIEHQGTLRAAGAVGRYVLEISSPLGTWVPLSTNLTATGSLVWKLTNITVPPNRFFRTRQP